MLEGNFARVKFGYTGHRLEERTGHWGAMHRQLDPRAGRWTQRDPAGSVDGENRYPYVANQPLLAIDLAGLKARFLDPRFAKAILYLEKFSSPYPLAGTRQVLQRLRTDSHINVDFSIVGWNQPLGPADTSWVGLATNEKDDVLARKTYNESLSHECPGGPHRHPGPLRAKVVIYMGLRKKYNPVVVPGDNYLDETRWIAARMAHELWHVDHLDTSRELPARDYTHEFFDALRWPYLK